MADVTPKVALLSTGDELTNGSVLNTNSFQFADRLLDHFIQPGMHLTVNDEQSQIEQGIRFLLVEHQALVISGGLGPTSDDRTRFALATVIGQSLIFDEESWQRIVARLNRLALQIPECNRQQCLFPIGAEIYPNDNGTAPGFRFAFGEQQIFMVPGPPFECMPMLTEKVIPFLLSKNYARPQFRYQWLLLNVSEGNIAALLDPLVENSDCQIGYRIHQPYLQIKLQSAEPEALAILKEKFSKLIEEKSISHHQLKASRQLQQYILEKKLKVSIVDHVTGGLMATALLTPETFAYLQFNNEAQQQTDVYLTLIGLENYWNNRQQSSEVNIFCQQGQKTLNTKLEIPFRKERTPLYAMEMACWKILTFLQSS